MGDNKWGVAMAAATMLGACSSNAVSLFPEQSIYRTSECTRDSVTEPPEGWEDWSGRVVDAFDVRSLELGDPFAVGELVGDDCLPYWQRSIEVRIRYDGGRHDFTGVIASGVNSVPGPISEEPYTDVSWNVRLMSSDGHRRMCPDGLDEVRLRLDATVNTTTGDEQTGLWALCQTPAVDDETVVPLESW